MLQGGLEVWLMYKISRGLQSRQAPRDYKASGEQRTGLRTRPSRSMEITSGKGNTVTAVEPKLAGSKGLEDLASSLGSRECVRGYRGVVRLHQATELSKSEVDN